MEPINVCIEQGLLRGKTDTDLNGRPYFAFLGIPYAKPPIANLRFKVLVHCLLSQLLKIYK